MKRNIEYLGSLNAVRANHVSRERSRSLKIIPARTSRNGQRAEDPDFVVINRPSLSISKRTLSSGEKFITHDMVVRRDDTSWKIKDATNSRGMRRRGSNMHALT